MSYKGKEKVLSCPPSSPLLSLSSLLLAVVRGSFRTTCLASDFSTFGTRRHRSQKSGRALLLSSSLSLSLPLTSASSAGVCHPPLSQTDVCLPVYCSWPGRLVGVQASALSLTLWNTTAVRLLPDSMLMVWFTSPMFNHETEGRREEERERIW